MFSQYRISLCLQSCHLPLGFIGPFAGFLCDSLGLGQLAIPLFKLGDIGSLLTPRVGIMPLVGRPAHQRRDDEGGLA